MPITAKFADKENSLESKTPMSARHMLLYQTFVANCYRMSLLLLEKQKRQKDDATGKSKLNMKEVKNFLANVEQENDSQTLSRL